MTKPKTPPPPLDDFEFAEAKTLQKREVLVIGHQRWELEITQVSMTTREGRTYMSITFDHPGIVLEASPSTLVKVKKPTL